MTSLTLDRPATGGSAPGASGGLTFDGVLRSEWIKLLSLRSIRWSLAIMLILSWGGAALMGWALSDTELASAEYMPSMLVQAAALGTAFTVLIMGVLGVLAITSEYSSGLILSSLTAVPSRTTLLAAKGLVVAALALVASAVGVFGSALVAAIFFGADGFAALGDAGVIGSLLSTTVYLVLATLLSFGVGALLRSSAGAISVVVVLLFVSTVVLSMLTMTGWAWVDVVGNWMPAALGNTLTTIPIMPGYDGDVSYWGALGGLAAWAAVALVPAFLLVNKRDAV